MNAACRGLGASGRASPQRRPRREGGDWFCDVTTTGAEETQLPVGGVDAWQALRLAMRAADAIIDGHPGATCDGIPGAF